MVEFPHSSMNQNLSSSASEVATPSKREADRSPDFAIQDCLAQLSIAKKNESVLDQECKQVQVSWLVDLEKQWTETFSSAEQVVNTTRFNTKQWPPIHQALLRANNSGEMALESKRQLATEQGRMSAACKLKDDVQREATHTYNVHSDRSSMQTKLQSSCDAFCEALTSAQELLDLATAARADIENTPDVWASYCKEWALQHSQGEHSSK